MPDLTPREIVVELDRHIVGQDAAKRAVAVAIRNRWRRQQLDEDMRQEVAPKNILMIGPTGVGKTEIARRLAKLTGAPFIKVEATRYTEVGYYGRDVESMVRELVENSIGLVRQQEQERCRTKPAAASKSGCWTSSRRAAVVRLRCPTARIRRSAISGRGRRCARCWPPASWTIARWKSPWKRRPMPMMFTGMGMEQMDVDLQGMFEKIMPKSSVRRELTVADARRVLVEQETDALINQDKVHAAAIDLAENLGIIFIDEMDKVVASEHTHGADVSRQGVQRDLLPIVEGTTVQTRYGYVTTDHILFIAAGAFHRAKPSDLMPELQGRFPIRVELTDLDAGRFHPHFDRAEERLDEAVRGAAGHRGRAAAFHDRRHRVVGRVRLSGEPADAEHRRPAALHDHGADVGGIEFRGPRSRPRQGRGQDRRRLCPPAAARRGRRRGPEQVHLVRRGVTNRPPRAKIQLASEHHSTPPPSMRSRHVAPFVLQLLPVALCGFGRVVRLDRR